VEQPEYEHSEPFQSPRTIDFVALLGAATGHLFEGSAPFLPSKGSARTGKALPTRTARSCRAQERLATRRASGTTQSLSAATSAGSRRLECRSYSRTTRTLSHPTLGRSRGSCRPR